MTDNSGYQPKDLIFGEQGRKKLIDGITKIASAVKSTLGPRGNTVLIESPNHTHGITVTKDGVTVAKSIDLLDPIENMAVKMMKQASDRTSADAGDGTTSSIVLTEAFVKAGLQYIKPEHNRIEILRAMTELTKDIVVQLRAKSKRVNKKTLREVASISANNDKAIGKIISDAYDSVGRNGMVMVEKSQSGETYCETTNGMRVERGYTSLLFINDHKRDECIFENVKILVCDSEMNNVLDLDKLFTPVIKNGDKLLIIAPLSNNMVNTLVANVVKNGMKFCNITPPSFGYKQNELMQDIALAVGATYFSEKTGDDLSLISYDDLGTADKVIVSRDSTVIMGAGGIDSEASKKRIEQLKRAHGEATKPLDKAFIKERIASLTDGIGVIYVGGNTDLEQKELYDRVDDSVCAVRSALEEGIVAGGGKALYDIKFNIDDNSSYGIASKILRQGTVAPLLQILENAGFCAELIYGDKVNQDGQGFDVKNEVWGDMISMGVIDPLKVTRCALQNAVSVAVTILSTDAIITMARSYDTN